MLSRFPSRLCKVSGWVALAALALLEARLAGAEWAQWGGPRRDFTVADPGLAERWPEAGPRELWRRPLGDGYSGIAVAGDLVVTLRRDGVDDVVVALDAATGERVWRHGWPAPARPFMDLEFGPGPHSTPLVAGERVFAVGGTGRLVALDRASGRPLWARELWEELEGTRLERGYAASPIAFEELVIVTVGGPGRAVVAFRQSDGAIAWSRLDHGAAYASPILLDSGGGSELVALLDKAIVGLDPGSGALRWRFAVSDHRYVNVASPFDAGGGRLFLVSSEGGRVLRLERDGAATVPRELWVGRSIGSQVGNVVRFGDHLYGTRGASASKYLAAVAVETGEVAWRDRVVGDASLLRVGERALILEGDGRLHLASLSPAGLEILFTSRVLGGRCWTAPALAGTRLYLRNRSEIVALDLGAAAAHRPAPGGADAGRRGAAGR